MVIVSHDLNICLAMSGMVQQIRSMAEELRDGHENEILGFKIALPREHGLLASIVGPEVSYLRAIRKTCSSIGYNFELLLSFTLFPPRIDML